MRFTFSELARRREVLGRLLVLNHQWYEEEVRMGLHAKGKAKVKAEAKGKRQKSRDTGSRGPVGGRQVSLPGIEDDSPQ